MHSSSSPAPRLDQGLLSREEASRGPVAPCAQRCPLHGGADHNRALPCAEQDGPNVSTIRQAACAANDYPSQMFHEFADLAPNGTGAESFIGDRHTVRYFANVLCRHTKSVPQTSFQSGICAWTEGQIPPSPWWSSRMTRYGASLQVLQFVYVPQSYGLRSFRYFPPKKNTTHFSKETAWGRTLGKRVYREVPWVRIPFSARRLGPNQARFFRLSVPKTHVRILGRRPSRRGYGRDACQSEGVGQHTVIFAISGRLDVSSQVRIDRRPVQSDARGPLTG
jgi:hypothetical protein